MKKYLFLLSVLALLFACTPQEMDITPDILSMTEVTLRASFENTPTTKTTLVDSTKVYWLPGDEITVFSGKSAARFTSDIKEKAAESSFTGTIAPADKYPALYPYTGDASYDGNSIKATLPSGQKATDGNVANGYLLSAGVSSKDGKIMFRNLVSGICFTLESEGVKYVELHGNDGELIAGSVKVKVDANSVKTEVLSEGGVSVIRLTAPDDGTFKPGIPYYIICAPTVFSKGLSLEMFKEEDVSAVYSIDGRVELKRSKFGRIPLADQGLVYKGGGFPDGELPASNEIWYTTSDKQPLSQANDQGGINIVSNTYGKGMGILRFSGPLTRISTILSLNEDCGRLTGILLPDCVEAIEENLFWSSPNIREFRIPASLKRIVPQTSVPYKLSLERFTGHHVSEDGRCLIIDGAILAFAPAGLSSYEIPAGVVRIAEGAFATTKELKTVVIPDGVTDMERSSFGESSLESVTIPASVKALDAYSFIRCTHLKNLLGDSPFISKDRKFLFDPHSMIPNMLFFFAGRDDESYEIPEGINAIENYAFYGCDKLKSITFPQSLSFLAGYAFEACDNLEALYGSHTTADHKGFITDGNLQFLIPAIDNDYTVPDEVTRLGDHLFSSRQTLRSVTMGDQVTSLGDYVFAFCPALKTVTLSANLASIGYNPFQFSRELESVYFRSIIPPVCSSIEDTENYKLTIYVPSQSLRFYTVDNQWKKYWDVMKPYDYSDLPAPDFYISSDYSREGEVTVYQKASEGNGIDIVFLGDAYSDRQIADGLYLHDMKACAEQFFAVEPYKTFRNLFNVYFVTAVSATEGYARGGRSLGTYRGLGTFMGGNDDKCFELARKAVGSDDRMGEVLVAVCGNQDLSGAVFMCGTCNFNEPETWAGHDYACGPAVTYFTKVDEDFVKTGKTLRHEAGGHGFAKLADEYHYSGSVSVSDKELIQRRSQYMWYSNVDITDDPAKVKWANFLADSRYKNEVGIYEGGFTYEYGVWRPSKNSVMNDNEGGFNAPSRYTIWYRIHKLAYGSSWKGTFEDFATYDAINR